MGPISGLDAVEERRTSCSHQESNPSSMAVEPVACLCSDWVIETHPDFIFLNRSL